MPGKAAKITITERQQDILQTFSRAATAASRLRQRASIIVLAFDGLLNEDIAPNAPRSSSWPSTASSIKTSPRRSA